ncbi:hypothetical protein SCH4B_4136 [Ruegeria sp. TrichCH4B]|nr:hypothetical protein SCH4B_4136 [Ruegeria sp. TrichCH4B]
MAAKSALCKLTVSGTSQVQRTAEMAGCASARNSGWLRKSAKFAKSAICASLTFDQGWLRPVISNKRMMCF